MLPIAGADVIFIHGIEGVPGLLAELVGKSLFDLCSSICPNMSGTL
jgi:hypothetical protein